MSRDRDIERAIQDGERNQYAKRLIHNWCRHARVEKIGGTGLVEMQTGLPIGHQAMVCDFASAAGMATWLLEESAVRFHDANCVGCPHRVPVGVTCNPRARRHLRPALQCVHCATGSWRVAGGESLQGGVRQARFLC